MEVQFYGGNCVRVTTKKSSVIVDDLSDTGAKSSIKDGDTVLFTHVGKRKIDKEIKLFVDQPGEYEVSDVAIQGIPARSYGDEAKTHNSTIYKIENDEMKIAVVGNVYPELTDAQLERLGEIDVLIIPVGGNESTLSGKDALILIRKLEPFVVIPTHYASAKINYETPQATLEEALKDLAMEPTETVPKLKLKAGTFLEGDAVKLIVLEEQ